MAVVAGTGTGIGFGTDTGIAVETGTERDPSMIDWAADAAADADVDAHLHSADGDGDDADLNRDTGPRDADWTNLQSAPINEDRQRRLEATHMKHDPLLPLPRAQHLHV